MKTLRRNEPAGKGAGMTSAFKKGEIVTESIHPAKKMIVSSYAGGIYYCVPIEHRNGKSLVYFERELKRTG